MRCRHFGECGGCSLPGMDYARQLAWKRERLADALGVPVDPVVPSPEVTRFRHKVSFVFGSAGKGRGLVMGLYAAGSRRIVPVRECPVHSDRGNRIAFALRDALARFRVAPHLLRHVLVRTTSDEREALATLVVRKNARSLRAPIAAFLAGRDRPDGFHLNVHDRPNALLLGERTVPLDGRRFALERGLGPTFRLSPTAFFQTNVGATRRLVELVLSAVGPASPVLDLYCGGGLFSLPLALGGARVVAVEENPQAIADLAANLGANHVPSGRVRPVCARVEDYVRRARAERFEAVILDPPRSGCAAGVWEAVLGELAPRLVVYVSCAPAVLARDLPRLRELGWRPTRIAPVDMFPHTEHVETVAILAPAPTRRGTA